MMITVTEKTKHTRKFQVHLGNELFDVKVDKHGKVWVADKKIKSDLIYSTFTLGKTRSEIYVEHWPFGLGIKSLWFKIKNQTAYFERSQDQRAQRIECVLKNVIYAGIGLLFGVFPVWVIMTGLTRWLLSKLVSFTHLEISSPLLENVVGVASLAFGLYLFRQMMWGGVSKDLLVEKKDLAQVEQEYCYDGLPFGYNNDEWVNFKSKLQQGDEIWLWRTPGITWTMLTGREGLVIVRNGKTTRHTILTGMN